jgi:hypothetical protein
MAHHCKGNHANDPGCSSPPPPPPPPPPPAAADPKFVFQDEGAWLSNGDGSGVTLLDPDRNGGSLDAGMRALHNGEWWGGNVEVRPYTIDGNGAIVPGDLKILVPESAILAGNEDAFFASFGITDWSPGGDRYAYTYWSRVTAESPGNYRIMVAPIDENNETTPFSQHDLVWDGAIDGGMGQATWDVSGDFIYLLEEFNLGTPQILLVIDVSTNPGAIVASADITPLIEATGFQGDSNGGPVSASFMTGTPKNPGDPSGSYSFDPDNPAVPARSDTSLCLMLSLVDWSTRRNDRFVMILDLPAVFEDNPSVNCPIATPASAPILNFAASDFTDDDAGIIGQDTSKNRSTGIWIYDLATGDRTKILNSGVGPDWIN